MAFAKISAMPAVVGVDVWHETSLLLVVLLAGLASLPREPMEAARVDGANPLQMLWTVTIPLMAPVILIAALIRMISAMKTYDLIYILTSGGPGGATETISFRIWKIGFTNLNMGQAAAASILLLLAIMALTLVLIRVMRRDAMLSEAQVRPNCCSSSSCVSRSIVGRPCPHARGCCVRSSCSTSSRISGKLSVWPARIDVWHATLTATESSHELPAPPSPSS